MKVVIPAMISVRTVVLFSCSLKKFSDKFHMDIGLEGVFRCYGWVNHETNMSTKIAAYFNFATNSKFFRAVVPQLGLGQENKFL